MSFPNLSKTARRLSRSARRRLGYDNVSSDTDDDMPRYNRDEDPEYQERLRQPPRPRSPTRMQTDYMRRREEYRLQRAEQEALQRQASESLHNREIDAMISNINNYLRINVDDQDPRIRFVIAQTIRVHGLSLKTIQLLRRSPILLNAIRNIIASGASRGVGYARTAGDIIYSAGQEALLLLRTAAQVASRAMSKAFSRAPSSQRPSGQRARSRSPVGVGFGFEIEGPPDLGFNEVIYPNVPVSAPPPAPEPEPVPPPAEQNKECSICMENALSGEGAVVTNCRHRFHKSCIDEWFKQSRGRSCPYCRTSITSVTDAQNGGGSKKYRSKLKSKSKSKSKSRRFNKTRKSRKLKRRTYSSRRK